MYVLPNKVICYDKIIDTFMFTNAIHNLCYVNIKRFSGNIERVFYHFHHLYWTDNLKRASISH